MITIRGDRLNSDSMYTWKLEIARTRGSWYVLWADRFGQNQSNRSRVPPIIIMLMGGLCMGFMYVIRLGA